MGTPTSVFRALTLAPADLFVVKEKTEDREKIWKWITEYTTSNYPMVCTAKDDFEENYWVRPNHSYSLVCSSFMQIGAAMLEDS